MKALITGITGQDGSYLSELLLAKGYEVYGLVRRSSVQRFERLGALVNRIHFVQGDLSDQCSLDSCIRDVQPDEVYNLAAQSFVPASFSQPVLTSEITGLGVLRMLEAIRRQYPKARFVQASSSEMFGKVLQTPQNENTRFYPRSPYGTAKVFGHYVTINYRESYGLFACSAISFNHESPRRGFEFVTRKVTRQVALIKCGLADKLLIGNLDPRRDWGYAADYVHAMWLMLQQAQPDDFCVATGVSHSVREFVEAAFACVDLNWREYVVVDPALCRPADVDLLCGDASKARRILGWGPTVDFATLVKMMVVADIEAIRGQVAQRYAAAVA